MPGRPLDVVFDIVDPVSDEPAALVVEANLSMLDADQGGRSTPFYHGYRPNHNFGDAQNRRMYIGQIELKEGGSVSPGEKRKVIVRFINAMGLKEQLTSGKQWRIQEGLKLVGIAEFLSLSS